MSAARSEAVESAESTVDVTIIATNAASVERTTRGDTSTPSDGAVRVAAVCLAVRGLAARMASCVRAAYAGAASAPASAKHAARRSSRISLRGGGSVACSASGSAPTATSAGANALPRGRRAAPAGAASELARKSPMASSAVGGSARSLRGWLRLPDWPGGAPTVRRVYYAGTRCFEQSFDLYTPRERADARDPPPLIILVVGSRSITSTKSITSAALGDISTEFKIGIGTVKLL